MDLVIYFSGLCLLPYKAIDLLGYHRSAVAVDEFISVVPVFRSEHQLHSLSASNISCFLV